MATSVSFNGATYTVPDVGDTDYTGLKTFFQAVCAGAFQRNGGLQPLSADIDLAATYGILCAYFKSKQSNIAQSGVVRLAQVDSVAWRNNANSADLALKAGAQDQLQFNSVDVGSHPMARYTTAAGQVLAASSTVIVNFDTSDYDTNSAVTVGASWHFTVPTGKAGKYLISAIITPTVAMAATAGSALAVYKNGSQLSRIWKWSAAAANNGSIAGSDVLSLVASDQVDIRLVNATASNVTLTSVAAENHVAITRLQA